jgi:hypothetical protein
LGSLISHARIARERRAIFICFPSLPNRAVVRVRIIRRACGSSIDVLATREKMPAGD